MRKILMALLAILTIALTNLGTASDPEPGSADPAEPQPAEQPATPAVAAAPAAEGPVPLLSPLMQEITARLERMRAEIRELTARHAATRDPDESTRLQRAIEAAKVGAELDVLRIQVVHARREGRLDAVADLEAAIELMTSPPTAVAPAQPGGAAER